MSSGMRNGFSVFTSVISMLVYPSISSEVTMTPPPTRQWFKCSAPAINVSPPIFINTSTPKILLQPEQPLAKMEYSQTPTKQILSFPFPLPAIEPAMLCYCINLGLHGFYHNIFHNIYTTFFACLSTLHSPLLPKPNGSVCPYSSLVAFTTTGLCASRSITLGAACIRHTCVCKECGHHEFK